MHTPPKTASAYYETELIKQNYWLFFPYVLYIVYNEPYYIIQVSLPSRKGALVPLCFHRTDGTTVFTKRNLKWISASTKKNGEKQKERSALVLWEPSQKQHAHRVAARGGVPCTPRSSFPPPNYTQPLSVQPPEP